MTEFQHDIEERLRNAFAARADLVTPESLRRESPPPPAVRRLPRWVVPGVTGLAVAATAAGVLVVAAPARDLAGPAGHSPSASVVVTPKPTPIPTPARTASRATTTPSAATPPVRPSGGAPVVPALAQVVKASGWRLRVPSTWLARPAGAAPAAEVTCVGTDGQPCLLRVAAGLDAAAPPRPGVLGGGVLPGFSTGSCRRAAGSSTQGVGSGLTATVTVWTCGADRYLQLSVTGELLLVVARSTADPAVPAVVDGLQYDDSYHRAYVVHSCPDVPLDAGAAGKVRAGGLTCADATSQLQHLAGLVATSVDPAVRAAGWNCSKDASTGTGATAVSCTEDAGGDRTLAYEQQ